MPVTAPVPMTVPVAFKNWTVPVGTRVLVPALKVRIALKVTV